MDAISTERQNIVGGIELTEVALELNSMNVVTSISNIHPMLKVYFDSPLGSAVETTTLAALTEAVIDSIEGIAENFSLPTLRSAGAMISQALSKQLYFAKLIHHVNKGLIPMEQFFELGAAHIAGQSVTALNRLWDTVGMTIPEYLSSGLENVLQGHDIPAETASHIARLVNWVSGQGYSYVKAHLTEENLKKIIYSTLKFTTESLQRAKGLAAQGVDAGREVLARIAAEVKDWGRKICERFDWELPAFLKDKHEVSLEIEEDQEISADDDVIMVEDVVSVEDSSGHRVNQAIMIEEAKKKEAGKKERKGLAKGANIIEK